MDLALALGRPIGSMPEREFSRWRIYFRRKSFPLRRLEFYLAQIAMLIAQTMGGSENVSIDDFMFEPARDDSGRMVDRLPVDVDARLMEEELIR